MSKRVSEAARKGLPFVSLGRVSPQTGLPMLQRICRCQAMPQAKVYHSKVIAR